MSVPRLASISIDLDGLAHYARLHGLAAHDLPESALSAVARLAHMLTGASGNLGAARLAGHPKVATVRLTMAATCAWHARSR
jgi:HPt (histidine-containing phosphotransfer) domain-containing protein